jgi:hypothetical protein
MTMITIMTLIKDGDPDSDSDSDHDSDDNHDDDADDDSKYRRKKHEAPGRKENPSPKHNDELPEVVTNT